MPGCSSTCTSSYCAIIPFGEKKKHSCSSWASRTSLSKDYMQMMSEPRCSFLAMMVIWTTSTRPPGCDASPKWTAVTGRKACDHWEKNELCQSVNSFRMPMCNWLCISCLPPHLINIIIILIMLRVSSRAPVNWWSLIREWHAGTWRWGEERERGEGAGGARQRERARPGRDRCDKEIFTTAVGLICIFYKAVTDAASAARSDGAFTTVVYGQIISNIQALMMA